MKRDAAADRELERALDRLIKLFEDGADCPEICPMRENGDCEEYGEGCGNAIRAWLKA